MSLKGLLFVMLGMTLTFASYFYWDYKKRVAIRRIVMAIMVTLFLETMD